ncbi:RTA1 like protein-domain-containing protein [Lipomyces oligophaga]|uniref:RTA1 like protein-domain-containing protein n=1 Tax=Lipomyces oligophaga TaxID=45792 RepID=UPI0034CD2B25
MNSTNSTGDGYAPFDLYSYNPALYPAYAFMSLFGILGIIHFIFMFPYRSAFPIPMIIGCGMEAVAYYFRSRSHNDVRKTMPFIIQNLLVLASPPMLAATIYMSLRRIARALKSQQLLLIGARWLTKLFVLVDLVCFVTQVAGAIMSGSDDSSVASRGKTILLAGLVLQCISFGFFIACAATLHGRINPANIQLDWEKPFRWQPYIVGLYIVSVLFIGRNVVRIIEFQQGSDGVISSSETLFYVFDAGVMMSVVLVVLILHPGRLTSRIRHLEKADITESIPLREIQ